MSEPLGADEPPVAGATREPRVLRAEESATYGGVNAIGAHQRIDRDPPAILELGFYWIQAGVLHHRPL
jgi:hypothetical protein